MANVVCFYSLQTVVEQVCFFNAVATVLIKQGNYIVNMAEVKEFLVSLSTFYYFCVTYYIKPTMNNTMSRYF